MPQINGMSARKLYLAKSMQIVRPLPDGDVPAELLVFPEGAVSAMWEGGESATCYMDAAAAEMVMAAFAARGRDTVIDYEHQTEMPQNHPAGHAPAAGWITAWRYAAGEGLYAVTKWTERAAEYIKALEYRYFSPVWYTSNDDLRICEVCSLALTNNPALIGIKPIAASIAAGNEVSNMKLICTALGIAETATEAQIVEAVNALKQKADPAAHVATLAADCGVTAADRQAFVAAVKAMARPPAIDPTQWVARSDFDRMAGEVKALRDGAAAQAKNKFMADGQAAGKITAGNRELWEMAYDANPTKAAEKLVAAAVIVQPGVVSSPTAEPANESSREQIIATASAKWQSEPGLASIVTRRVAFINDQLREKRMAPLNKDEEAKYPN